MKPDQTTRPPDLVVGKTYKVWDEPRVCEESAPVWEGRLRGGVKQNYQWYYIFEEGSYFSASKVETI